MESMKGLMECDCEESENGECGEDKYKDTG